MKIIVCTLATALVLTLITAFATPTEPLPSQKITVLLYHAVLPYHLYYPLNADNRHILSEEIFRQQMQYLYENNFNTITAAQLIAFLNGGEDEDTELPENPILITFDDGYLDNALIAAPILRALDFTAIQFLIGEEIHNNALLQLRDYPLQFMGTHEIYATKDVFAFASHTHAMHHRIDRIPVLRTATVEEISADIEKSLAGPLTLSNVFAYPFGGHSENAIYALQKAGFDIAFIVRDGYVTVDSDPLMLPRFDITSTMTMSEFSQIVHGEFVCEIENDAPEIGTPLDSNNNYTSNIASP